MMQAQQANVYATIPVEWPVTIRVDQPAPATFWGIDIPNGYIGVQTDGSDFRQTTDVALVSIFGGAPSSGGNCAQVGEGNATSCRIDLPVVAGGLYTFSAFTAFGWTTFSVNGQVIGTLQTTAVTPGSFFVEYFGPAVQPSVADFWSAFPSSPFSPIGCTESIGAGAPGDVRAYPWGVELIL